MAMASRHYTIREMCQPRGAKTPCDNEARYTTSDGHRVCAIHGSGVISLRDTDVADAISLLDEILRAGEDGTSPTHDQIERGRGLIGRIRYSPSVR